MRRNGVGIRRVHVRRATAAVALAVAFLPAGAFAGPEVEVVRPRASVKGKTIGEWTGQWWKAAIEATDFPFSSGGNQVGSLGNIGGPVFFAVASPGSGRTTITYNNVPRQQYVLVPLYTYSWASHSPADPCSDLDCAIDLADRFVDGTTSISVRIDGERVDNPFRHYAATPFFFRAKAPVDGWWAAGDPTAAGRWFGVASGIWLMLEPLSPGTHVLSIAVKAPYSSVCEDGSDTCDIPSPGPPEWSQTTLILRVR